MQTKEMITPVSVPPWQLLGIAVEPPYRQDQVFCMIVIWGKQGEEGKRTNVEVKDAPQMVDDQLNAAMSPLKTNLFWNTCVTIRTYRPIFIYLLGVLILES